MENIYILRFNFKTFRKKLRWKNRKNKMKFQLFPLIYFDFGYFSEFVKLVFFKIPSLFELKMFYFLDMKSNN